MNTKYFNHSNILKTILYFICIIHTISIIFYLFTFYLIFFFILVLTILYRNSMLLILQIHLYLQTIFLVYLHYLLLFLIYVNHKLLISWIKFVFILNPIMYSLKIIKNNVSFLYFVIEIDLFQDLFQDLFLFDSFDNWIYHMCHMICLPLFQ